MKDKSKEAFLLLAPIVGLVIFGVFKVQQSKAENARFKPLTEAIHCEYLPRTQGGKQAAKIEIVLSHDGTTPKWWGQPVTVNLTSSDIKFHVPGKNTWWVPVDRPRVNYHAHDRRYIVAFERNGSGSQLFSLYRGTLRGKVTLIPSGDGEAATFQFDQAFHDIKGQSTP